jgi:hypothetical protein
MSAMEKEMRKKSSRCSGQQLTVPPHSTSSSDLRLIDSSRSLGVHWGHDSHLASDPLLQEKAILPPIPERDLQGLGFDVPIGLRILETLRVLLCDPSFDTQCCSAGRVNSHQEAHHIEFCVSKIEAGLAKVIGASLHAHWIVYLASIACLSCP